MFFYKKPEKVRVAPTLAMRIEDARRKNKQILEMKEKVEDEGLQKSILGITKSAEKIIAAVEKDPKKYDKVKNFFEYYLPVTISILGRYDEIENQKLTNDESIKFMKQKEKMMAKIDDAFKNQLAGMYQNDIIDTDAEMKVFDSMLKADGYDTDAIKVEKEKEQGKEVK